MTQALDSIGLYVVDCNMLIQSFKQYSNLEDLKSDAINGNANIILEVDCFIGNCAWREDPLQGIDQSQFLNDVLAVDVGSINDIIEVIKESMKNKNETFDS